MAAIRSLGFWTSVIAALIGEHLDAGLDLAGGELLNRRKQLGAGSLAA